MLPYLPVYDLQCDFCYLITMYDSGFTEAVFFFEDVLLYWHGLFLIQMDSAVTTCSAFFLTVEESCEIHILL